MGLPTKILLASSCAVAGLAAAWIGLREPALDPVVAPVPTKPSAPSPLPPPTPPEPPPAARSPEESAAERSPSKAEEAAAAKSLQLVKIKDTLAAACSEDRLDACLGRAEVEPPGSADAARWYEVTRELAEAVRARCQADEITDEACANAGRVLGRLPSGINPH